MKNVREFLNWNNGYYEINREERNLAAIFYHALLLDDNLSRFLKTISCHFTVNSEEMGIYFEYSYLRDLWYNIKGGNEEKRELIYRFLEPSNIAELKSMDTFQFNKYFGAVPNPSRKYIQSPGNWSISKYSETITDNNEFLKVCKFKWAFNAKPDIVIHTSNDSAVCIECKFESSEGSYPTKPTEMVEFQHRGLGLVSQTSLQKYVLEELLGINTQYIFLVQKDGAKSETHSTLLWKEAFSNLKMDNCPTFIKSWVERL